VGLPRGTPARAGWAELSEAIGPAARGAHFKSPRHVLYSLLEVEFGIGMPERNVRRGSKQTPASRFNRLRDLKQRLGEHRKRQVESRDYFRAERPRRLEPKIQAELKVSTPFGVIMFSGFNLRR
jgi:hypothetical protein